MQIQSMSVVNAQLVQPASASVSGAGAQRAGAPAADVGQTKNSIAAPATATVEKSSATQPDDLEQALQQINDTVQTFSQKLEFSVDKDTEAVVVKVVDRETREVIRQIPSEEVLNIAKALDKLQGLLIKEQA